ncbi:hypothetical protein [Pseudomonas trivialis]|uniref:hypothetical protein n=1 Tax=Pseudomonas trivialis TaxID=200450 RepID=UPI0009F5CF5F|nr:hypothetical protein [Pseudomonas trivialis]
MFLDEGRFAPQRGASPLATTSPLATKVSAFDPVGLQACFGPLPICHTNGGSLLMAVGYKLAF